MKVLQVLTSLQGGAGIAATRIHKGLLNIGVDSWIITRDQGLEIERQSIENLIVYHSTHIKSLESKLTTLANLTMTRKPSTLFTPMSTEVIDSEYLRTLEPDVIHVHNSYNFFNLPKAHFATNQSPSIVYTLHDERFLTGGCHCTLSCENYLEECRCCPQAKSVFRKLPIRNLKQSKSISESNTITLVAPSQWLYDVAKDSPVGKECAIVRIPNGVPTEIYRSREDSERLEAQSQEEAFVISWFSGKDDETIWRALDLLHDSVSAAEQSRIRIRHTGNCKPTRFLCEHVHTLFGDEAISEFYRGSSCFVLSTHSDNFPNVCLEAMSCGVPVIVSQVGGAFESVREAQAGTSFPAGDSFKLRDSVLELLRDPDERNRMAMRGQEFARSNYSLEGIAIRYRDLYEGLVQHQIHF